MSGTKEMTTFAIGDRVELVASMGLPGTVTAVVRGKCQVRFDDLDNALWILRPDSLQRISGLSAAAGKGTR